MEKIELINKLNLRNIYAYTSSFGTDVNIQIASSEYDGVMLPISRGIDGFYILEKDKYEDIPTIKGRSSKLTDFLESLELGDKELFLSMFNLFDECKTNYQKLRRFDSLIKELQRYNIKNLTINNNLYDTKKTELEDYSLIAHHFKGINYVYTVRTNEEYTGNKPILPKNVSVFDLVTYIKEGKYLYLTPFLKSRIQIDNIFVNLLKSQADIAIEYDEALNKVEDIRNRLLESEFYFDEAKITLISNEPKSEMVENALDKIKRKPGLL